MRLSAAGFLVILLPACEHTVEGIEHDTEEAARAVATASLEAEAEARQELEEFKSASRTELARFDRQLDELERKTEALGEDAENELDQQLEKLKQERKELQQKLDQLDAKTETQWQQTKRDIDAWMAELGRDINRALDKAGDKAEQGLE